MTDPRFKLKFDADSKTLDEALIETLRELDKAEARMSPPRDTGHLRRSVSSGYRSVEAQRALAAPGSSHHFAGAAMDASRAMSSMSESMQKIGITMGEAMGKVFAPPKVRGREIRRRRVAGPNERWIDRELAW